MLFRPVIPGSCGEQDGNLKWKPSGLKLCFVPHAGTMLGSKYTDSQIFTHCIASGSHISNKFGSRHAVSTPRFTLGILGARVKYFPSQICGTSVNRTIVVCVNHFTLRIHCARCVPSQTRTQCELLLQNLSTWTPRFLPHFTRSLDPGTRRNQGFQHCMPLLNGDFSTTFAKPCQWD